MPARDIRDEMQSEPVETQSKPAPPPSPIQIVMEKTQQKNLVDVVLDDYDAAKQHRDQIDYGKTAKGDGLTFETWLKGLKAIYTGYREPKVIPWQYCSNRSLKIAMAILEMMFSRLFPAVWNEDLTRWRPGEYTDTPKAERISKLMYWWVRVWAPCRDFFEGWTKYVSGFGDVLTEGSWAVEEYDTGKTEEIPILDQETQMPLTNPDGSPAIQNQRMPNRVEKTALRLHKKDCFMFLKGARDVQQDPVIIEEEIPFKDLEAMELQGKCMNVTTELSKHIIVPEPTTNDPMEKERIRKVKMRNVPVKIVRWYGHYDVDGAGINENVRIIVSKDHRIYLGGVRMRDITKSGKRPLEFTKFSDYADKPEEMFGQGILDMVRELAEEIDAIFNQFTDGNTLNIMRPGFYDPSGDVDANKITLAPNKMVPVTNPAQNVYFPNIQIDTARLIDAIRLVLEFVERLTAASAYVMGRESEIVGGSGTATRTQAIVQSAEMRFTRPAERLKASAMRIVTMLLDLIQLNIPPGMETRVLGEKGEQLFGENELSQQGISGKFDAYAADDPAMGSKTTEREISAMLYSILMQNMIVATDPAKIYKTTADLLKAYGKEPIEYLGPEPMLDAIDEPEDENTLIVEGDFERVRPNIAENHLLHIFKHNELLNSPSLQLLAQQAPALYTQVVQYVQQHIQEHTMMMQAMTSMVSGLGKNTMGGGKNGKNGTGVPGENSSGKTGSTNAANSSMANTSGPLAQAQSMQRTGKVGAA